MSIKNSDDLRTRRTRRWLQAALRDLMQEKPYDKIKVSEIVENAEVARPTFYLHYETKDDLLLSLFDDLFAELREELSSEFAHGDLDLKRIGLLFFSYGEKNTESLRILLEAGVGHLVQEQIHAILLEVAEELRAIDTSTPQKVSPMMPYLVDFITGGTFMALKRWIQEDTPVSSDALGLLFGEVGAALQSVGRATEPH